MFLASFVSFERVMDVGGLFGVRVDNQIEISLLLVFASSFEEVVTLYVIRLDVHLSAPRLTQVLPKLIVYRQSDESIGLCNS